MSTALGPLIDGALIALFGVHDGWRAVFFVNVPIGDVRLSGASASGEARSAPGSLLPR